MSSTRTWSWVTLRSSRSASVSGAVSLSCNFRSREGSSRRQGLDEGPGRCVEASPPVLRAGSVGPEPRADVFDRIVRPVGTRTARPGSLRAPSCQPPAPRLPRCFDVPWVSHAQRQQHGEEGHFEHGTVLPPSADRAVAHRQQHRMQQVDRVADRAQPGQQARYRAGGAAPVRRRR